MKNEAKIFSLLKADHRKVESLFSKTLKSKQSNDREGLYAQLRKEITMHSEAEEKTIYPTLKQNEETADIAFESVEEHSVVKFLLEKLDSTPIDRPEWMAQVEVLQEVIEHHVEEEEKEMFKKMRKAFSKLELEGFARDFEAFKASSPQSPARDIATAA